MPGFHLDIDSRDGKIMLFRNKGWRQGLIQARISGGGANLNHSVIITLI